MVKLTRIYTRTGDDGNTTLVNGSRIPKHHIRMETIGAIDEANAAIGLARVSLKNEEYDAMLERIQHDMFDLGADVANPLMPGENGKLRIITTQIVRLEGEIDRMNAELPPLQSFVLPGGSPASATLHLARTIVRRAERKSVELAVAETVNPHALCYLNRLSDHLFVLARACHANAGQDVLWRPGATR